MTIPLYSSQYLENNHHHRSRSPSRPTMLPVYSHSPSLPSTSRPLSPDAFPRSPSSDDDTHDSSPERSRPHSPSGVARKVAASLQLFKESQPHVQQPTSPRRQARSQSSTLAAASEPDDRPDGELEEVGEAQFVKRAAWPDRESVDMRRQKSSTALERMRTRDDPVVMLRDELFQELVEWRNDIRHLPPPREPVSRDWEVVADDGASPPTPPPVLATTFAVLERRPSKAHPSSPHAPRARATPPSTSPTSRPLALPAPLVAMPSNRPLPRRAAVPPFSPWTTDDETWDDSASATTFSTATTSALPDSPVFRTRDLPEVSNVLPEPYPHEGRVPKEASRAPLIGDDAGASPATTTPPSTVLAYDAFSTGEFEQDLDLQFLQGKLPHIPLRPFRNQVGGHSAIYKFTKRAVCKARRYSLASPLRSLTCLGHLLFNSLSCHAKISSTRP